MRLTESDYETGTQDREAYDEFGHGNLKYEKFGDGNLKQVSVRQIGHGTREGGGPQFGEASVRTEAEEVAPFLGS